MSKGRPPPHPEQPATGAAGVDDLPSDSEFLELLDADATLSHFLQRPPTPAAVAGGAAVTTDPEVVAVNSGGSAPLRAPPRSFLIGGSLFAKRTAAQCTAGRSSTRLGSLTSGLVSASIFCPFTHQYISLRSPHWDHLSRAGFGLSSARGGAYHVTVHSLHVLYKLAKCLQGCEGEGVGQRALTAVSRSCSSPQGAVVDATACRRDALYAAWGWTTSLQHTLGELLCSAPLSSPAALANHMHESLRTEYNYREARAIVVATTHAPWRMRWADLQRPRWSLVDGAAEWDEVQEEDEERRVAVRWAETSLQHESGAAEAHAEFPDPLPDWASLFSARPALAMLGMPAHIRAAFLEIPFSSQPDAPPLMASVCAAVLSRLARDLSVMTSSGNSGGGGGGDDVSSPYAPRLYYCPLAHGVDYSGVLDLMALQVPLSAGTGGNGQGGVASPEELCAQTAATSPTSVLALGMEGVSVSRAERESEATAPPPLRLVVFDNAHFLSKRAVSRLLDQWTRNGAAVERQHRQQRAHRRRHMAEPAVDASSPTHWQTLMGVRESAHTVLPHLRTLATPFGSVQALFLSYRAASHNEDADAATATPVGAGQTPADAPMATIRVSPQPQSDVLYVEETLSAALLRVSTLYRLRLTPPQRRALLDSVLASVLALAHRTEGELQFVKHVTPRRLPSDEAFVDTVTVRLDSPKGQTLFFEACEALLLVLSPLDAFMENGQGETGEVDRTVRVLTTYPTLSELRVRHLLVSTYHLEVSPSPHAARAAGAALQHCSVPRVSFLASRQCGYVRESQERHRHVLRSRIHSASSAKPPLSSSSAPAALLQTYSLYAEPPLLVGRWWTATLLFCAPTLADVVTLRSELLCRLREYVAATERRLSSSMPQEGEEEAGDTHDGSDHWRVEVEDVDIFHSENGIDAAAQQRQNCRVFGVRALARFCPRATQAEAGGGVGETRHHGHRHEAMQALEGCLQQSLKLCASRATFFPLWTYHAPRSVMSHTRNGGSAAQRESGSGGIPDFAAVAEWRLLWVPSVVERRLFTLAVAQRPPAALAVGTRVILRETVRVPAKVRGGGGRERDTSFPRGCVCRVTGFITVAELRAAKSTPRAASSSLPDVVRRQVRAWTAVERRHIGRYTTQQQHASSLPLLRRLRVGAGDMFDTHSGGDDDNVFLLIPQPFLVGGYRSTHYYALPVLHLPIYVISGGGCGVAPPRRKPRTMRQIVPPPIRTAAAATSCPPATSRTVPLDCVLTDVFHPYQSHASSSRSALCLTQAERAQALRLLFARMAGPPLSPRASASGDTAAVPSVQGDAAAPGGAPPSPHSPLSFMEDVLFYEAEGSAPPDAPQTPPATVAEAPITCALLTELGLYAPRHFLKEEAEAEERQR